MRYNDRLHLLTACGAALGLAGGAAASVVLAIELLLFEFSARAFLPLVVAASVAAGVHHAILCAGPLFTPPAQDVTGLGQLPLFAALGLGCGLLAVVIAKGLFAVEHGFRRLPGSDFWHPVLGSLGFALVGLFVPRSLTEKLTRRGLRVRIHYEPDVFQTARVADVMQPPGPTSVTGRDEVTAVRPDDPLVKALTPLADLAVADVPVIDDDGNLLGVCTRHDLLSARAALLAHEHPQPGWLARRRHGGPP
jgi:Voltage gated chloride channel/CBS domain